MIRHAVLIGLAAVLVGCEATTSETVSTSSHQNSSDVAYVGFTHASPICEACLPSTSGQGQCKADLARCQDTDGCVEAIVCLDGCHRSYDCWLACMHAATFAGFDAASDYLQCVCCKSSCTDACKTTCDANYVTGAYPDETACHN